MITPSAPPTTFEDGRGYFLAALEYGTHPWLQALPRVGPVDHCRRGHDFTPANTLARADGYRDCRECRKEWRR